jgi:hypothetical protein
MIPVIILCAGLCALACLWVLKPLRTPKAFYGVSALCAVFSLGIYLLLGSPELPGRPTPATSERQMEMRTESTLMIMLEKNPNDADAMIRLAALYTLQGREQGEILKLLDKAKAIRPNDRRITIIRSMVLNPSPELKK